MWILSCYSQSILMSIIHVSSPYSFICILYFSMPLIISNIYICMLVLNCCLERKLWDSLIKTGYLPEIVVPKFLCLGFSLLIYEIWKFLFWENSFAHTLTVSLIKSYYMNSIFIYSISLFLLAILNIDGLLKIQNYHLRDSNKFSKTPSISKHCDKLTYICRAVFC